MLADLLGSPSTCSADRGDRKAKPSKCFSGGLSCLDRSLHGGINPSQKLVDPLLRRRLLDMPQHCELTLSAAQTSPEKDEARRHEKACSEGNPMHGALLAFFYNVRKEGCLLQNDHAVRAFLRCSTTGSVLPDLLNSSKIASRFSSSEMSRAMISRMASSTEIGSGCSLSRSSGCM